MNEKQVIRAVLKHMGLTQPELSERMGYAKTTVGTVLADKHELKFEKICKMLDACGCEIVVRPKDRNDKEEWVFSEDTSPIEAELYAPDVDKIRSEMKPPVRK